jgi:DNA-binding NarL/FixJ family response regulator
MAAVAACSSLTAVVVLSVSEASADVLDAVSHGAVGYLSKTTPDDELRAALRRAAAGDAVFTPTLAALVLGQFRRDYRHGPSTQALTPREHEILRLVARGYTSPEISARLYISARTVDSHVKHVLSKLQLSRRIELAAYAARHRL